MRGAGDLHLLCCGVFFDVYHMNVGYRFHTTIHYTFFGIC